MFSLLFYISALVSCSKPVLSQWAESEYAQYTTYSGLISGIFQHPQAQINQGCPNYTLGPHNRSYLYVGRFPSDGNPFFFELYHFTTEASSGIVFTNDSIYNLDFTSVAYPCMKSGALCGLVTDPPWYFVTAEMLDLGIGTGQKRAVVERVQVNGTTGYKVSGDQTSFISNGTVENKVNVARPLNQSSPPGCMETELYVWNSSVPFTYNLTFTQTLASISLYIVTAEGALTLSFDGTAQHPNVTLFTTDPNVPTFNISFASANQTRASGGRESRRSMPPIIYTICILWISLWM